MPTSFSKKNSSGTIYPIPNRIRRFNDSQVFFFSKVKVIAWLGYELAYYDSAVHSVLATVTKDLVEGLEDVEIRG